MTVERVREARKRTAKMKQENNISDQIRSEKDNKKFSPKMGTGNCPTHRRTQKGQSR